MVINSQGEVKYIMIPAMCLLTGVASANECKYSSDVDTSFEGVISKSQNYDKKTYPYIDDTRKCVVSMDVKINDKWHPTSGTYVFGPDTSENDACKNAELSAKENILRTTVPEKLNKTMEQKCKVEMTEKTEPPTPKASPTRFASSTLGILRSFIRSLACGSEMPTI